MTNKDNLSTGEKNNVFPPTSADSALESLPTNYVLQAKTILDDWFKKEKIKQTYSKVYISRVKNGSVFNEEIMKALVKVGENHKKTLEKFGRAQKKTSQTN